MEPATVAGRLSARPRSDNSVGRAAGHGQIASCRYLVDDIALTARGSWAVCHGIERQRGINALHAAAFLSYHHDDYEAVEHFVDQHAALFRAVYTRGVTEGDDFVASPSDDLIIASIRDRYLSDAALAIVLLGESTWSRRFIDWEIAAALGGPHDEPLAVVAFAIGDPAVTELPPRLAAITPHPPVVHCLPAGDAQFRSALTFAMSSRLSSSTCTPLLRTDIRR